MKEIKSVIDKINVLITNSRILTRDLESILIPISNDYHMLIIGSQGDDDTYFDIPYDSVITFTNKQSGEKSIYFFNREAGKFITNTWLNQKG